MLKKTDIEKLTELRKKLHTIPEPSKKEVQTSHLILNFLSKTNPKKIIKSKTSNGFAVYYGNMKSRNTIVIRSELDGVPVEEKNNFPHKSINKGFSHSCGHDGHMAITCGAGLYFGKKNIENTKLILLFQHAEETGEGANQIIQDNSFDFPDNSMFLGFHNIPGFEKGQILFRDKIFCPGSTGIEISINGKPAHASAPNQGISPIPFINKFISEILNFNDLDSMISITHVNSGKPGFGVVPGDGQINLTLRSFKKNRLEKNIDFIKKQARSVFNNIEYSISFSDYFPAVESFEHVNNRLRKIFLNKGIDFKDLDKPMPWSEDFSFFLNKYNGAFFGIGSGKNQPGLHNENYDFPDDLIEAGVNIFIHLINNYYNGDLI